MNRAFFLNLLLVCISAAIGLVLVEAAYRVYLWTFSPAPKAVAVSDAPPSYSFYDRSHWEYDEQFGYVYPPGRKLLLGSVTDGRLASCDLLDTINARGNIGPIRGDYDSAALKVLLFGDSFPAFIVDGETFPSRLQAVLREKAGLDAHVVNFGRDGTGILQMFDLAAAMVPKWQPDLAIFTFISDDLDRVRIWRTPTRIDGEPRLLVTDRPDEDPGLDTATDAFILFPEASREWCDSTLRAGGTAPELEALNARYLRMKKNAARAVPNYLALNHSFVLSRVLEGNAFARASPGGAWRLPRVELDDYRDDPRFVAALETLQRSGVPILLIHLPIAPELMEGQPNLLGRQAELWQSLEAATGEKVYRLADRILPPLENPLAMSHKADDHHPSAFGMQVYANAIVRILAEDGVLPEVPPDLERLPPVAATAEAGVALVRSDVRCPFRQRQAGEAPPPWQLPLWQVFRHYRPPPPLVVTVTPPPAGAVGDAPAACTFDVLAAPDGPVPGLDWRIGHNLFFGADFWHRTLTFRLRLRADRPMQFGDAALILSDGSREARTAIDSLDGEWRDVDVAMEVAPETTTMRLWLQLSHESTVSPAGGRIEMTEAEAVIGEAAMAVAPERQQAQ